MTNGYSILFCIILNLVNSACCYDSLQFVISGGAIFSLELPRARLPWSHPECVAINFAGTWRGEPIIHWPSVRYWVMFILWIYFSWSDGVFLLIRSFFDCERDRKCRLINSYALLENFFFNFPKRSACSIRNTSVKFLAGWGDWLQDNAPFF